MTTRQPVLTKHGEAGWSDESDTWRHPPRSISLESVPFMVLVVGAFRARRHLGLISVTITSMVAVAVATNLYGYWVVFFPVKSRRRLRLIFVAILPVQ